MNNRVIVILISFFVISACSNQKKFYLQDESHYIIDLDGKKETSLPLSNYFKSGKTIILETTEECLIGKASDLQVFDNFIYILDWAISKSLFIFDMDGRFVKKIGRVGNGPGEFVRPEGFTIDTENRFIYLLDYDQRIHKYHFDGTFIKTITVKIQNTNVFFIQYYKNKLFLSVRSYNPTPEDYMLLEADLDGKILSSYLPLKYNKRFDKAFLTGHSFFISRLNDTPKYTQLYMDYIFTIGDKIVPYIELQSKDLTTEKDFEDLQGTAVTSPSFETSIIQFSKIWDVNSFIENDDIIIFRYLHGPRNNNTVIYNKKTNEVKLAYYLNNDLMFKNDIYGFYRNYFFSDTKGAYEIQQVPMIKLIQESIRNNDGLPEFDKMDEFLNLEEDTNPVIFYYEFR